MIRSEQTLQNKINIRLNTWIGILFILLVSVNAFFKYDLYPSDCCVIVNQDDQIGTDTAKQNKYPLEYMDRYLVYSPGFCERVLQIRSLSVRLLRHCEPG